MTKSKHLATLFCHEWSLRAHSGHYFGNREITSLPKTSTKKRRIYVARACARHILVSTNETCENLKTQIEGGEDFGDE